MAATPRLRPRLRPGRGLGLPLTEVAGHLGIDTQTAIRNYVGELDEDRRRREVARIVEDVWDSSPRLESGRVDSSVEG